MNISAYSDSGGNSNLYISELAEIAEGCEIMPGAFLGARVTLEKSVKLGPNAVVLGNECPDSTATTLHAGVVVGANAVVHAGVVIGAGAIILPGTIVKRSVPPGAIVEGNPAAIVGYVDAERGGRAESVRDNRQSGNRLELTPVKDVVLHHFPIIHDLRGNLTVGEFDKEIPFAPRRYFMVFGVPNREVRGEHAHHICHQFLICVRGSCAVVADDGNRRVEVELDSPSKGLYLPPLTWGIQYKYTPDALLLVFASHHYDAADYIRDYDEFLMHVHSIKNEN